MFFVATATDAGATKLVDKVRLATTLYLIREWPDGWRTAAPGYLLRCRNCARNKTGTCERRRGPEGVELWTTAIALAQRRALGCLWIKGGGQRSVSWRARGGKGCFVAN